MHTVKFWEVIALVNKTQRAITVGPWSCHLELQPGEAETMYSCPASDWLSAEGRDYFWTQDAVIQNPESAAFVLCTPELITLEVYGQLEDDGEPQAKAVLRAEPNPQS